MLNLFKKLPLWAYGVECEICQETFNSADVHLAYVTKKNTLSKHKDKIPILKK